MEPPARLLRLNKTNQSHDAGLKGRSASALLSKRHQLTLDRGEIESLELLGKAIEHLLIDLPAARIEPRTGDVLKLVMTDGGIGTAEPEIPVRKGAVQNEQDEFERDLRMLLRGVVDFVVAKAALGDSARDDPPEIVLRTTLLKSDAFEPMMESLGLPVTSIEEGFNVEKDVLALRGVAQLIQGNVGATRDETSLSRLPKKPLVGRFGLIHFALKERHEVRKTRRALAWSDAITSQSSCVQLTMVRFSGS